MIQENIDLNLYNTYKVGGVAEYFVKANTLLDLINAKQWALENNISINYIGRGSNLLIFSGIIEGLTIVNNIKGYSINNDTNVLTVNSGECISSLAMKLAKEGYSGLEWAAGIPGSIGGAITMNAGAHSKCISDVLIDTTVLSYKNNLLAFNNKELDFSYRNSNIQNSNYFVVEGRFQLQKESKPGSALEKAKEYLEYRVNTQPYNQPSCGSVFRNPLNKQCGKLIEDCLLKGFSFFGAEVSTKHANFIINQGDATGESIYTVMNFVEKTIKSKYNINLLKEVKLLGNPDEVCLLGYYNKELNELFKKDSYIVS